MGSCSLSCESLSQSPGACEYPPSPAQTGFKPLNYSPHHCQARLGTHWPELWVGVAADLKGHAGRQPGSDAAHSNAHSMGGSVWEGSAVMQGCWGHPSTYV